MNLKIMMKAFIGMMSIYVEVSMSIYVWNIQVRYIKI